MSTPSDEVGTRSERVRDILVVVILSVTTILTAWSGFQSSKWGGAMSISFSQASSARIEAARFQGNANTAQQVDLSLWTVYVQARATQDEPLEDYVRERFTPHFAEAFDAWVADGRVEPSPLGLDAYVPPGRVESADADTRADTLFNQALAHNQRGDNYTILTVNFAVVLFFAAISGKLARASNRWFMVGLAGVFLVAGVVVLATYPVLV